MNMRMPRCRASPRLAAGASRSRPARRARGPAHLPLCIALGVAAIVGVNWRARAARGRPGARTKDGARRRRLVLADPPRLPPAGRPSRRARLADGGAAVRAMARGRRRRGAGRSRAAGGAWPRLGAGESRPGDGACGGAWAERGCPCGAASSTPLLARLDLKLGDPFEVGEAEFVIRASIVSEPDRLAAREWGSEPQVMMSRPRSNATRLIQPGSLMRWTTRVLLGAAGSGRATRPSKPWSTRRRRPFRRRAGRRSPARIRPISRASSNRFGEFLTLVSLVSLMVGGVGVANAAEGFVERKRRRWRF